MSGDSDEGAPLLDPTLRERVIDQIAIVKEALDTAAANPSDSALDELQAAADQLMRALGRVLIEIERYRKSSPPHP